MSGKPTSNSAVVWNGSGTGTLAVKFDHLIVPFEARELRKAVALLYWSARKPPCSSRGSAPQVASIYAVSMVSTTRLWTASPLVPIWKGPSTSQEVKNETDGNCKALLLLLCDVAESEVEIQDRKYWPTRSSNIFDNQQFAWRVVSFCIGLYAHVHGWYPGGVCVSEQYEEWHPRHASAVRGQPPMHPS